MFLVFHIDYYYSVRLCYHITDFDSNDLFDYINFDCQILCHQNLDLSSHYRLLLDYIVRHHNFVYCMSCNSNHIASIGYHIDVVANSHLTSFNFASFHTDYFGCGRCHSSSDFIHNLSSGSHCLDTTDCHCN